ncbi:hypothetical protein XAB3213_4610004 [Xanthomonas citri pv. bilvae]|nr:hypothetical protein XAB3213_4610004 [Xanthomonas citri pv. bilvae]
MAGMQAVGSGKSLSLVLVAVSSVFTLVRHCCATLVALGFDSGPPRAFMSKLHPASYGTLGPGGSAGEQGCTIQPLRPLTA